MTYPLKRMYYILNYNNSKSTIIKSANTDPQSNYALNHKKKKYSG